MAFFKVTNIKTGDSAGFEFNGTSPQFVRFYGKGFGMPDGERVEEVVALPEAAVPTEAVESKSVAKRKSISKEK